jgi:hypothetical protein
MRTAGVKAAVAACWGVAALVGLIARRLADDRAAESAAGALANLAHGSAGNAAAIAEAGGRVSLSTSPVCANVSAGTSV